MDKIPATADLYDAYPDRVHVVTPALNDYGGEDAFAGPIATVRCCNDNSMVRTALSEPGRGRVLVVDGHAFLHCALLGDKLAMMAVDNGWSGVVIWGCVRDTKALAETPLGIKALAANPRRSEKRGQGERDISVVFLDTCFIPGHYLYADVDGILISDSSLGLPEKKRSDREAYLRFVGEVGEFTVVPGVSLTKEELERDIARVEKKLKSTKKRTKKRKKDSESRS